MIKIINFAILFFFNIIITNLFAIENKILIKVDQKIITSIDVLNEINFIASLNPSFHNLEKSIKFEIAQNALIKQAIKEKEIYKAFKEIDLAENDFKKILLSQYSIKNFENITALDEYLKKFDLNMSSLKNKIEINVYWNEMIKRRFDKNVRINEEKIRTDLKNNNFQKEFNLSEIIFSINEGEDFDSKLKKINETINDNGFEAAALQFSISDTSQKSGKIGWIKENNLNEELKVILDNLSINMVSKPIRIPSGFLIIRINDIRKINKYENFDKELELVITMQKNNQLAQFSNTLIEKIKKNVSIEYE